jgi:VanZ family protein
MSAFSLFSRYWLPLIAYCLLIFFQSGRPSLQELPALPFMDKWLHLAGYALLGMLFDRAYRRQWPQASPRLLFWASVVSTALYGLSDEFHQYFVPARSADPLDAAADALGGLLGVAAFRGFSTWSARRSGAAL